MKKIIAIIFAAIMMTTVIASCGNDTTTSSTPSTTIEETINTTEDTTEIETTEETTDNQDETVDTIEDDTKSNNNDGKFDTVAELIEDETFKEETNSIKEKASSSVNFEFYAEGKDTLVMDGTLVNTFKDEQLKTMKKALSNSYKHVAKALVRTLASGTNIDNPKVKLILRNGDGNSFYEDVTK